jgi:hypothetical protein
MREQDEAKLSEADTPEKLVSLYHETLAEAFGTTSGVVYAKAVEFSFLSAIMLKMITFVSR